MNKTPAKPAATPEGALAPVPARPSVFQLMAAEYGMSATGLAETLKKTIFPSGQATNEQLAAFCAVAHQYRLNPFLKEIYAFPAKGGGVMPIVSIDGWVKLLNRQPELEFMDIEMEADDAGKPFSATCTIKRRDRDRPTVITEYLSECRRNTDPWNQMPARMLRHKALSQCARYAFGFGGIQDEDEARDAVQREDAAAKPEIPTVARRSIHAAPPAPEPAAPPENPDADPIPVAGLPLDFSGDGKF